MSTSSSSHGQFYNTLIGFSDGEVDQKEYPPEIFDNIGKYKKMLTDNEQTRLT